MDKSLDKFSDKFLETVEVFGTTIPKYVDCVKCQRKLVCRFTGYLWEQPCNICKDTPEYQEELDHDKEEKDRLHRVNESLKGQLPVAVHEYRGRYLYTNHKGDILKDEKARPMPPGEVYKK